MNTTDLPHAPRCCDALARARIVHASQALGVPRDYGRRRGLRLQREPRELASIGHDVSGRQQWLAPRAARAFLRMREHASGDGVELQVVSAFRSADYQLGILQRKLARGLSMDAILEVSAAPGFSEHHSGRALDLTAPGCLALEESFEASPAFGWLCVHAARFGFALSYPRGNPHAIAYEPWHWCWHAAGWKRAGHRDPPHAAVAREGGKPETPGTHGKLRRQES